MDTHTTEEELAIAPWLKNYGEVPFHLEYPDCSLAAVLFESAKKYPKQVALSFRNKEITYSHLASRIRQAARAFAELGIKEGDTVTICMPNLPQTVVSFYALNSIGALASMIHPLSSVHEIAFFLKEASSRTIITIDQFYAKIVKVKELTDLDHIIIASVSDELGPVKKTAYRLLKERKFLKVCYDDQTKKWKTFFESGKNSTCEPFVEKKGKDVAVILFSGGTTGTSKGIQLTNLNFNAVAYQTGVMCNKPVLRKTMLAAMPMFHGFGLGVCIHSTVYWGGKAILVPQVSVKSYSKLLKTAKPNYIAGVPTLYEGIISNKKMDGVDLSCLLGVFSGGDALSIESKERFDKFLSDHGATVRVREGYGTTECVTVSCLTPYNNEKEGSIGLPCPDTYYGIFKPGTTEQLPFGEEGEICLRGPSVMVGYLNHPEEDAITLIKHPDGFTWLHTGDAGKMDDEGFIYFKQRIKRIIVTSGYSVYPSQLENVIDSVEEVRMSCCIGVPDPYKMAKIKAFVVLKPGIKPSEELKQKLVDYCRQHIAKYAMPYDFEFRPDLPKTLVGKIAYTVLEKEEAEKQRSFHENQ